MAPWLAALLGAGTTALLFSWRFVARCWHAVGAWLIRHPRKAIGGMGILTAVTVVWAWSARPPASHAGPYAHDAPAREDGEDGVMTTMQRRVDRMMILGMDGLDPEIMNVMMDAGLLPAFTQLRTEGAYEPIATVVPPESPVVWSSFATGVEPTDHGIFDFIHRDPADYGLDLSITQSRPGQGYVNPRGGVAFWKKLADAGVPVRVLFAPCVFPPEKLDGQLLAGMGTPDLKGHMGRYVLISTDPTWAERKLQGDLIGVADVPGPVRFELPGPRLAGGLMSGGQARELTIPVELERADDAVHLAVGGQQFDLAPGQWSPWVRLTFKRRLAPPIHGICRFYLVANQPQLQLYCTPIQFDPAHPVFPISHPESFSSDLAGRIGLFATLGLPLDTKAYEDGALDAAGFRSMGDALIEENRRALQDAMREWDDGLIFCYFNTPDPIQHMFWSDMLKQRVREQGVAAIPEPIRDVYRQMDRVLAETMAAIDAETRGGVKTDLVVLSDHGFAGFRHAVELNRLLSEWGYLTLKPGRDAGGPLFDGIDWSETRAYACGFTSIYLNLASREQGGIVKPAQRERLLAEIREKLLAYEADATGERVFTDVVVKPADGPFADRSPDLVVGAAPGYRVSWVTALGGVGQTVIESNPRQWRGDHIIDASAVPGIILVNKEAPTPPASIVEVSDWVLARFGVPSDPLRLREND